MGKPEEDINIAEFLSGKGGKSLTPYIVESEEFRKSMRRRVTYRPDRKGDNLYSRKRS